jgi:hypothetical protein
MEVTQQSISGAASFLLLGHLLTRLLKVLVGFFGLGLGLLGYRLVKVIDFRIGLALGSCGRLLGGSRFSDSLNRSLLTSWHGYNECGPDGEEDMWCDGWTKMRWRGYLKEEEERPGLES